MAGWRRYLRSLRVRAAAVVIVVAVAPLLFVATANVLEDRTSVRMTRRLRDAAAEASRPGADLDEIGRRSETWIRVLAPDGAVEAEARHARGAALEPSVLERLFDDEPPPELATVDAGLGPALERDEVRRLTTGDHAEGCRTSTGQRMLVCFAAVAVETADGPRIVVAEDGVRRSIQSLHDLWSQLITLTVVIVPIAVGLGLWLGWRMVRPLEKLQAQVRRHMPSARGSRLSMPRSDEFGDLAADFNELLRRHDDHARQTEAFVADLAHEFKNPVAAVRAAADALEARPHDPARVERLAATLQRSSIQLDELVSQFLELARAEAGFAGESRSSVDVGALARAVARDVAADPRRAALQIDVDVDDDEAVSVEGLALRIEVAVRNLLGNACDFASSRVGVTVRRDGSAVAVEVTDDGPGIPAEDRGRIFDRFYSRRKGAAGTGLGLAMVRATAHAHGGDVEVSCPEGGGTALRLLLPR